MHESNTCFHNLESPLAGATMAPGWQQLRGWLVAKRGFHFVDVRARLGALLFPGVYGFPRADLAVHFEPARAWLPAEYTIEVEFPPGPADVTIEALAFNGQWQAVRTVSFLTQGSPAARATGHDPLAAEDFAVAVQQLLKQEGAALGRQTAPELAESLPYPPVLRPNHPPFHGFIDEPAVISPALYGRLPVLGWLFHETLAIRKAYVSTDLLVFQRLELGGEFPGVKERFPHLSNARHCRLFGFADVSSQLPVPVSARFYAELEDGTLHLALSVQCRAVATEELKAPYPPFSALHLFRSWRTLRRAVAARGIPMEAGKSFPAQFGKTLLRFRREAAPRFAIKPPTALPQGASLSGKQRLLLLTHNFNREGAPLLFLEYARYLSKNSGRELVVVSGQEGPLRSAFAELGAQIFVVDAAHLLAAGSPGELHRRVTGLIGQHRWREINAVVANTLFSFWGVELANLLRCPSLLYIHESTDPVAFFSRRIPGPLLPAVVSALESASVVSFNTPATQAYYRPYASGHNFQLTPAWIDLSAIEVYRAAHPVSALRQQLELKPGEWLVANIGTVCDRKGQHDFLRAIEWFWRLAPDLAGRCRFLMIGGRDDAYNGFIRQSIADLQRGNIEVVPETGQAYDYFASADLFVCTSYEESFPRVVLEAMAFEIPIVSTNVHGIPFMLDAEEDALLVNPGDIPALATALRRALEDPAAAKARAKNAFRRVQDFAASRVLPKHAALTAAVIAAQP